MPPYSGLVACVGGSPGVRPPRAQTRFCDIREKLLQSAWPQLFSLTLQLLATSLRQKWHHRHRGKAALDEPDLRSVVVALAMSPHCVTVRSSEGEDKPVHQHVVFPAPLPLRSVLWSEGTLRVPGNRADRSVHRRQPGTAGVAWGSSLAAWGALRMPVWGLCWLCRPKARCLPAHSAAVDGASGQARSRHEREERGAPQPDWALSSPPSPSDGRLPSWCHL